MAVGSSGRYWLTCVPPLDSLLTTLLRVAYRLTPSLLTTHHWMPDHLSSPQPRAPALPLTSHLHSPERLSCARLHSLDPLAGLRAASHGSLAPGWVLTEEPATPLELEPGPTASESAESGVGAAGAAEIAWREARREARRVAAEVEAEKAAEKAAEAEAKAEAKGLVEVAVATPEWLYCLVGRWTITASNHTPNPTPNPQPQPPTTAPNQTQTQTQPQPQRQPQPGG